MKNSLLNLPPVADLESKRVLRKVASAHRYLAELKGVSATIPNQNILINTLSLQEAKDSSAIENIITTHDDLFREEVFPEHALNAAAKEVGHYASALKVGFALVQNTGMLSCNHIIEIQATMMKHSAGFRRLPGTELKNQETGETVYTPPQDPREIVDLMSGLEKYINENTSSDLDPLIRMAVIHYQFESIHPFYDGNGRTGRIINVLYLVLAGLLDAPVLYLSRYIVLHKTEYYDLLKRVREDGAWEEWIMVMLNAVEETSKRTIIMIEEIRKALRDYKHTIRAKHKFYSQDLINNLFSHPYTKIELIMRDLKVGRHTASKYLDALCEEGLLTKQKIIRSNYYINNALYGILTGIN